jgi:hypothetical protein
MEKGSWIWGIVTVVVLGIMSLILINIPCNINFPYPTFCLSKVLFLIINFFGLIILSAISSGHTLYTQQTTILDYVSIIISIPIYFLIGFLLNKIFKRK